MSTPFDVIKTRMMNQPYQNGRGLHYASTLDCLVTTVRTCHILNDSCIRVMIRLVRVGADVIHLLSMSKATTSGEATVPPFFKEMFNFLKATSNCNGW